jgi:RNase H-fold protein (predicted Holliday junction resolvase)
MMILSIDPGREKSGIAIVDEKLRVYKMGIVPSDDVLEYIKDSSNTYKIDIYIMGNGTGSGELKERLERETDYNIILVEEAYTSLEAEKKYWNEHPPRGLKRLLIFLRWKPPVAVDDYAALVLAERYLKLKGTNYL